MNSITDPARFGSTSIVMSSSSSLSVGIAGAGVLGRLLAWQLARAGHRVRVFDPGPGPEPRQDGLGPAGFTAAGMLSPLAELDNASAEVAMLGWQSMARWKVVADEVGRQTGIEAPFRQRGSLLVAHGADLGSAQRVLARLSAALALSQAMPAPQPLDRLAMGQMEPSLDPHLRAWLLPGEGQVLPAPMLHGLARSAAGVEWCWNTTVGAVESHRLVLSDGQAHDCDLAIDVRGLGARPALPLRGVRGELVWLHAPGVRLDRPVRLLHPRHRVYIVPRPDDRIVIGASEIETEDRSGVSLRSGVELMAAAHSVIPALAEARICHLETNLRPALPDNEPRIEHEPGWLRINGLFRHGWLLAPALVARALAQIGLADPIADLLHTVAPAEPVPVL